MKKLTALLLCVMLVTGICASVSFVKAEEDGFFEDFELYKNGTELPGAGVKYDVDFGLFWATPGEDTFTVSNEQHKNGNKAAKIVANKNAADTGIILTNKLLKRIVKENDTYLFSFWYYTEADQTLFIRYRTETKVFNPADQNSWATDIAQKTVKAGEWTFISVEIDGAICKGYVENNEAGIYVKSNKTAGKAAYVDDVSLCKYQPEEYREDFESYDDGYAFPLNITATSDCDLGLRWADEVKESFKVTSSEQVKNGKKAAKIVTGSNQNETGVLLTNKLVKRIVKTNDKYLFSFWYYTEAPQTLIIRYRTDTKKFTETSNWYVNIEQKTVKANEWTFISVEIDGATCKGYINNNAAGIYIFSTKTEGASAYIDDISLVKNDASIVPALEASSNGNCDNGTADWFAWDYFGNVDGATVETANVDGDNVIRFTPKNEFSTVGFDLSPYIVNDSSMYPLGYKYGGFGSGYYTVSLKIKAIGLEDGEKRKFAIKLTDVNTGKDVSVNPLEESTLEREISNEWSEVSATFRLTDEFLSKVKKVDNKYNFSLQIDGSGGGRAFRAGLFDYYIDDLSIEYVKFDGIQPLLGSSLQLEYKVSSKAIGNLKDVTVDFELADGTKQTDVTAKNVNGRLVYTFKNISPKSLNDSITATVKTPSTTLYTKTYSIKQYCDDIFAMPETSDELRTLLADLLNYGQYTQRYAEYNTDNLADVSEAYKRFLTSDAPELTSVTNTKYATVDNASIKIKSASVVLTDAISCKFYFDAKPDEVKLQFEDKVISRKEIGYDSKSGRYYAIFTEVPIYKMDAKLLITAYKDGQAASNTLMYSIESYAASKAKDTATPYLADLVKAMINYGNSSKNYKNSLA